MKRLFIFLKKNLYLAIIIPLAIFIFADSLNATDACLSGLTLWLYYVLPSLFPFFVLSSFLLKKGLPEALAPSFAPIMNKLFKINGKGAYPYLISLFCGYPVGTKMVCNLYEENQLNKEEGNALLGLCSNPSPIFVITTATIMLNSPFAGVVLLFSTYLANALITFTYRLGKKSASSSYNKSPNTLDNTFKAFSLAITSSILNILYVGGYIIFFSLLIRFVSIWILEPILRIVNFPYILEVTFAGLISGFIEMTNGIISISQIVALPNQLKIALISLLLGFGGLCINFQSIGYIAKSDLSIKKFFLTKIQQGLISFIITLSLANLIKETTPCINVYSSYSLLPIYLTFGISIITFILFLIICMLTSKQNN